MRLMFKKILFFIEYAHNRKRLYFSLGNRLPCESEETIILIQSTCPEHSQNDAMAMKNQVRYIIWSPFSQQCMTCLDHKGSVVHAAKDGEDVKNAHTLEWPATTYTCSHIPNEDGLRAEYKFMLQQSDGPKSKDREKHLLRMLTSVHRCL